MSDESVKVRRIDADYPAPTQLDALRVKYAELVAALEAIRDDPETNVEAVACARNAIAAAGHKQGSGK
jgi:hypothetical protein